VTLALHYCTGIRVRLGASTASLPVSGTGPGTVMVTVTGHRAAGRGAGHGGTAAAARQGCSGSGTVTGWHRDGFDGSRLLAVRSSGLGDCLPWLQIEPSPQSLHVGRPKAGVRRRPGVQLGPLRTLQHSRTPRQKRTICTMEDDTHTFSLYGSSIDDLLFPSPPKNECGMFFPVISSENSNSNYMLIMLSAISLARLK
jgi:hypothetical protein